MKTTMLMLVLAWTTAEAEVRFARFRRHIRRLVDMVKVLATGRQKCVPVLLCSTAAWTLFRSAFVMRLVHIWPLVIVVVYR